VISVIIPVYNREEFIARAIDSVLAQSLKPSEIIVVDDGSSDKTAQILAGYHDKIRYIRQNNRGVSAARNVGIKKAKGQWICLLDSDDFWHPDKLKIQQAYHDNNPTIMISHTNERWIRDGKEVRQKAYHDKPSGWCFRENLSFCKIAPSTIMIAKRVFEKVGYFDEDLEVCEDFDLWLRILRHYALGLVEEVLTTKVAGHANQLSFKYHSMDTFRIQALLKHQGLQCVQEEIVKKSHILIKGAKKHGNQEIEAYYGKVLQHYHDSGNFFFSG
jgi:glycosyltransferase involved in cell wall biosynthesis